MQRQQSKVIHWGVWYEGKLDHGWCLDFHGRAQSFTNINEAHKEAELWRQGTSEPLAYHVKEML